MIRFTFPLLDLFMLTTRYVTGKSKVYYLFKDRNQEVLFACLLLLLPSSEPCRNSHGSERGPVHQPLQ